MKPPSSLCSLPPKAAQREDGRPAERRLPWRRQMAICGVRLFSDSLGDEPGLRRCATLLKENPPADASAQTPRAIAVRARHAAASRTPDDFGLSTREREALEHIAAGDGSKRTARVLDTSPHTLKRHRTNVLDKRVLASRGQAAAWPPHERS